MLFFSKLHVKVNTWVFKKKILKSMLKLATSVLNGKIATKVGSFARFPTESPTLYRWLLMGCGRCCLLPAQSPESSESSFWVMS